MGYHFNLPLNRDQLEGIGMVAVEWSYLESILDWGIGTCAGIVGDDRLDAITAHLNVRARLQMLATLFRLQELTPEAHDQFSDISTKVDALAARRNEVIHSRWITGEHGSPFFFVVKARGNLSRTKRNAIFDSCSIQGIGQQEC
jgi:hypothetical protein